MAVTAEGYVAAAVIAASAAFIGVIIGKEQKTTEFRQAWINAQRKNLAVVIACALDARSMSDRKRCEALVRFDEAHGRVRLRENPDKREWQYVLEEIGRLRAAAFTSPLRLTLDPSGDRIIDLSQRLLKTEWTRVRADELWFKVAKWALPPLVLLSGFALAYGKGFIQIG